MRMKSRRYFGVFYRKHSKWIGPYKNCLWLDKKDAEEAQMSVGRTIRRPTRVMTTKTSWKTA